MGFCLLGFGGFSPARGYCFVGHEAWWVSFGPDGLSFCLDLDLKALSEGADPVNALNKRAMVSESLAGGHARQVIRAQPLQVTGWYP
jgi:hypothetical protein